MSSQQLEQILNFKSGNAPVLMCVRLHRYPPLCINTYTWLVQIDYAEHTSQSAGEFICASVLWALTCALYPKGGGGVLFK